MSLRINTNVEALTASRHLQNTANAVSRSMEKLSSGYRINRGADDAAGLGISEAMRSQIRGLGQAQKNIQDGVSMVQTAEGSLDEVHSMLQRVRELAVQYKNGTLSQAGRDAIQTEVNALGSEIERIGVAASFNGLSLLSSGTGSIISFQVGANDNQLITVSLISLGASVPVTTYDLTSSTAISSIDNAIGKVSASRSTFGSVQNRLEHALNVSAAYQENLTAAESRIRDVDMAEEMTNLTKSQILQQAGQSMLAQANQAPQQVLSLIKG
jgi:flagellin